MAGILAVHRNPAEECGARVENLSRVTGVVLEHGNGLKFKGTFRYVPRITLLIKHVLTPRLCDSHFGK